MRLLILVIAVISALFFRIFLISVYKVSTQSMAPALLAGDYIIASKISFGLKSPWSDNVFLKSSPQVGDLVVYQKNSKVFVKRILALPKSEIEYTQGAYFIDEKNCQYKTIAQAANKPLSDKYSLFNETCGDLSNQIIKQNDTEDAVKLERQKLGDNQYFVASDFRNFEKDLSNAEAITFDQIIGKPIFIWMSYSAMHDFISNELGVRWSRIMTIL